MEENFVAWQHHQHNVHLAAVLHAAAGHHQDVRILLVQAVLHQAVLDHLLIRGVMLAVSCQELVIANLVSVSCLCEHQAPVHP